MAIPVGATAPDFTLPSGSGEPVTLSGLLKDKIVVLGFYQRVFALERGLTYPMLSDLDRQVIAAYDVKLDRLGACHDVANRAIFVIDRDGAVVDVSEKTPERGQPDVAGALAGGLRA